MKPKVSVIVPIYNVEKYIGDCLESLGRQTLHNIEILLINDLGDDRSMTIAEKYAATDKRMKIIHREKNGGSSAARNTGIKHSTAPFIMFCDPDDFAEPTFCEKLLNGIVSSGADMAICGTQVIYEADFDKKKSDNNYFKIKFNGMRQMDDSVRLNVDVVAWNKIYRRDMLVRHDIWFPEGLKYEDNYFFNAYAIFAKNIYFIPEKLYNYRRHRGSIMSQTFGSKPGMSIDYLKVGIAFYEFLKKHDLFETHRNYSGNLFFRFLNLALLHEKTKQGHEDIYKLALDFIRASNWCSVAFPVNLRRQIQMLTNQTWGGKTRKFWGGLIKIRENFDKSEAYFSGIPAWKVTYAPHKNRYYLFGFIRVFHKNQN